MNETQNFMKRHGLTDEMLDEMAAPFERGDYPPSSSPVHIGSPLDRAKKCRFTVECSAQSVQRVNAIAEAQGVDSSRIFQDALRAYLDATEK